MSQVKSNSDLVIDALIKGRNDKKLSQRELADNLGITQSKIAAIENRKRTLTLDVATMIADELDIDIGTIISPRLKGLLERRQEKQDRLLPRFFKLNNRDKETVLALIRHLSSHSPDRQDLTVAYSEEEQEEFKSKHEEHNKRLRYRQIQEISYPNKGPSEEEKRAEKEERDRLLAESGKQRETIYVSLKKASRWKPPTKD